MGMQITKTELKRNKPQIFGYTHKSVAALMYN